MGITSLGAATCFSCVFLFWEILSLALTNLSRSKCVLDTLTAISINLPSGNSIPTEVLAAGKWDFKFSYCQ
jgi:hypothetical protein